ncbi:MAG: LamG domain-containing protein [Opitutaceae bacterium]|nr:LamG domain-containing protein [Opitutaceae bacterium]
MTVAGAATVSGEIIAYWNFDNNGKDAVGNLMLAPVGGASWLTNGFIGESAQITNTKTGDSFQGFTLQTAAASTQIGIGQAPGTISFWVNPDSVSGWSILLSVSNSTGGGDRNWWIENTNGALSFAIRNQSNNTLVKTASDTLLTAGAWNHVVVRFTGTGINISVASGSADTHLPTSSFAAFGGSAASTAPLVVGGRDGEPSGSGNAGFSGSFDELAFFNTSLSNNEINRLFLDGKAGAALMSVPESADMALLSGILLLTTTGILRHRRQPSD